MRRGSPLLPRGPLRSLRCQLIRELPMGAMAAVSEASDVVAVDDEPVVPGYALVESAARSIGLLGLPVHPLQAGPTGLGIGALDQRSPDPMTASRGCRVEILQVAHRLHASRAAVLEIMSQPFQSAARSRYQCEPGLARPQ